MNRLIMCLNCAKTYVRNLLFPKFPGLYAGPRKKGRKWEGGEKEDKEKWGMGRKVEGREGEGHEGAERGGKGKGGGEEGKILDPSND
jgi:hypothetical protein